MPAAVLAVTLVLTGWVRTWLGERAILDHPVSRSSHQVPVPRGAGLTVIPTLLAAWLVLDASGAAPRGTAVISVAAFGLALLSWRDDRRGLPVGVRLGAHALAVLVGIGVLPGGPVFQGLLPPLADRLAAALLWLWFVNLYNFMDGIDGITAVETIAVGAGAALVGWMAGPAAAAAAGLSAAAAGLGFLPWNWHPARVFLGDVGSVPLGYMMGFLLLVLAGQGVWAPALILPLYYLADATITLARRVARGERFWQAHREHFYQRAVRRDGNHASVTGMIFVGDAVLAALAAVAVARPLVGLVSAVAAVSILLGLLQRRSVHGG